MSTERQIKVLVTGFGPFLDITTNPSWEIARQLPPSLITGDGDNISITVPPEPTPAAYHKIYEQVPRLIEQHSPDLIVHIGLDVDSGPGVFRMERGALKEGYHDIPDIERRVFTRADNKKAFAKSPASIESYMDIDVALIMWRNSCSSLQLPQASEPGAGSKTKSKGKGVGKQVVDLRLTNDVGTYVCGFQYYHSLLEMAKQTKRSTVVFLHVPKLEGEEQVLVGVQVVEGLIKALADLLHWI